MPDEIVPGAPSTEQVPPAGDVSNQTVVKPEQTTTAPTPEALAAMIQAEIQKALEPARREIQSVKDKARGEVEAAARRARMAESTVDAARRRLAEVDPDAAKDVEIQGLRARVTEEEQASQVQEAQQRAQAFHDTFTSGLSKFIENLGIDPKDKRIDWAADAPNYLDAQARVLASVAVIQKENVQTVKSGLEKRLKDLEDKMKQNNFMVNSVDTSVPSGALNDSDKAFLQAWGDGSAPVTKANVERAQKLLNS